MFRSATFRLTAWYVLLAACLSLFFSAVVYQLSTDELGEALNRQYNSFIRDDRDGDNVLPPHTAIERHRQHLFSELIWFNTAVIVGSSLVGYFLARRTLKPIEHAHQAQIRFTAEASHELRTPLAAMRADTEVALMERGLPAKTQRTLQGNLRDIERLESLTSHLLDIARYQNKATIETTLLDLDETVKDVITQLNHAAEEKHIHLKQNIRPAQIIGEPHGVRQLVTIALDNAIKYSRAQGGVTVSLRRSKTLAILTVKDNGIGIPPEDLPHIFERFYRSSNARSDKKTVRGYGLGLPLAQEIASAHHGAIRVTSRENKSTTVRITLPLASTQ
jgi:signal transduction histidine kinase